MEKLKVLVLFGGQSSEHSISELSATNIISNLNTDKYELYLAGITQAGKWYLYEGDVADIKGGLWEQSGKLTPAVLVPDATMGGLLVMDGDKTQLIERKIRRGRNNSGALRFGGLALCRPRHAFLCHVHGQNRCKGDVSIPGNSAGTLGYGT